MIASTDYQRAAGLLEPRTRPEEPTLTAEALQLSWALSRVAPLPTPDLANHLAEALLAVNPRGMALVQIGRMAGTGEWKLVASGCAGRSMCSQAEAALRKHMLWPVPPHVAAGGDAQPTYSVWPVQHNETWLASLGPIVSGVNLRLSLAAMASSGRSGEIVLTAQLAGVESARLDACAALLRQVLPWLLSIAGVALGERQKTPKAWLTQRERDVLEQLVGGASVVEIARALDRSHYTVHDHVKSLHRKLGVKSRAALIRRAINGVPPPGHQPVAGAVGPSVRKAQPALDHPRDLA